MFDYAASRATAERLIASFGQVVQGERKPVASGSAWAPELAPPAPFTATVVDLGVKERQRPGGSTLNPQRSASLVSEKVRMVITVDEVAAGDRLQLDGKWHEVREVRPLAPGGSRVLSEVDLTI